jgi:hypothetical protein
MAKAMRNYTIRLPQDIVDRLEHVLEWLGPRIRTATGKDASRADMFRAIMLRGLTQAEREFGLNEPKAKFILVDEEDGGE